MYSYYSINLKSCIVFSGQDNLGILRNLNDIKKVQIELAENESKYRELFDNSKDLIQSIDATGEFLYVNDAWLNTLGYRAEEVSNLNFFDIIHEDSEDYCAALLEGILEYVVHEDRTEHRLKMLTNLG